MGGAANAVGPCYPSVAWSIPSSSDSSDCTLKYVESPVDVTHGVGRFKTTTQINVPYLEFSDEVIASGSASDVVLVRPLLPGESDRGAGKIGKQAFKPQVFTDALANVCPPLQLSDTPVIDGDAPAPTKPLKQKKTAAGDNFVHMKQPPLLLTKVKKSSA